MTTRSGDAGRAGGHDNPPERATVRYRLATQPAFLGRMLDQLAGQTIPDGDHAGTRPLAALSTRERRDPTIALLDAVACVADVITLYQEYIANEGFLRTATEERSVRYLARALGYEPSPGVSASAWLAFEVSQPPGLGDGLLDIPAGTKVQSIPVRGEPPQTFESDEPLDAHAAWNALRLVPPTTAAQGIQAGQPLICAGSILGLQPGDRLLALGPGREAGPASADWAWLVVSEVRPDAARRTTAVHWTGDLSGLDARQPPRILRVRRRFGVFGHQAADWASLPLEVRKLHSPQAPGVAEWPGWPLDALSWALDAADDGVLAGQWLVVVQGDAVALRRVESAAAATATGFGMTAPVTRVAFDQAVDPAAFDRRAAAVYVMGGDIELAPVVQETGDDGRRLRVVPCTPPVRSGQFLLILGGSVVAEPELAVVERVEPPDASDPAMRVHLGSALVGRYDPASALICGNVVRASHGETVREVLGSGSAAAANQGFALRRSPLTHVPAANERGATSTLAVSVNGAAFREVAALSDQDALARVFAVHVDHLGKAELTFGDGVHGARLPTGRENVVARYRTGMGRAGNVPKDALRLLQSRPPGVTSVTNPLAAVGGADAETALELRDNAPGSVLTMGRVVSLEDYEDFARAYAGVGKASASALLTEHGVLVHLTIADDSGAPVAPGSALYDGLGGALAQVADPRQPVRIATYEALHFAITAKLSLEPGYGFDAVASAVREKLGEDLGAAKRWFAQPVAASEVVAVMQAVAGVAAVDLDALYQRGDEPVYHALLTARPARYQAPDIEPAQMLVVDAPDIHLEEDKTHG